MEAKMTLSAEEMQDFLAFKENKRKEANLAKEREMRETYRVMVDEEIEKAVPKLMEVSASLKAQKSEVFADFKSIIDMKKEMFRLVKEREMSNMSHTFTNSKGDKRITLGVYVTDGYLDTVEEGITIVQEYLKSLSKDEKSAALVGMVLRLLAKDSKGTLKASRVIQLSRIADEIGDERFVEGVRIIKDAYSPQQSKTYVRAEYKNDDGIWVNVPLGMTEIL